MVAAGASTVSATIARSASQATPSQCAFGALLVSTVPAALTLKPSESSTGAGASAAAVVPVAARLRVARCSRRLAGSCTRRSNPAGPTASSWPAGTGAPSTVVRRTASLIATAPPGSAGDWHGVRAAASGSWRLRRGWQVGRLAEQFLQHLDGTADAQQGGAQVVLPALDLGQRGLARGLLVAQVAQPGGELFLQGAPLFTAS